MQKAMHILRCGPLALINGLQIGCVWKPGFLKSSHIATYVAIRMWPGMGKPGLYYVCTQNTPYYTFTFIIHLYCFAKFLEIYKLHQIPYERLHKFCKFY